MQKKNLDGKDTWKMYTARKDTDGLWTEMLLTLISEQRLIYVLKVVG
jgi:hypothetical protein